MNSKILIIDGRLWQTATWSRGMGRYMLGLVHGMGAQATPPRVLVLVSDYLPLTDEQKSVIKTAYPGIEIHSLPIIIGGSSAVEKKNVQTVDEFIKVKDLTGSTFIQASLFTFDFSPYYPMTTFNTAIFYDLIPLKFWDIFYTYFPEHEYFSRFRFLYMADKLFAISESVKSDLTNYLGLQDEDVVNIAGADIPTFLINETGETQRVSRDYKYVFLPGGDAPHKNMLNAIRGFDIFNAEFGDTYRLIITSFYSPENEKRMREASPNIELTGQVSDEELDTIYKNAELVLFPSLDEGLGLPILEAVRYGKKIACSDIPTFKELSKDAFSFFDPTTPDDIARALLLIVTADEDITKKYHAIQQRFTWKKSAHTLLATTLEKKKSDVKGKHAIIVEQDRSVELTRQMALVVSKWARSRDITLFVDTLDEDNAKTPLVFNHIFKTYDITDAIRKTHKKQRTIIFTAKSIYSQAIKADGDEVLYVGTTPKKVESKIAKVFGE